MKKTRAAVILFVLLLAFWLILSSKINLTIVIVGFFASLLILFINYDLIFNHQEATRLGFRTLIKLVVLFYVLISNIILSNIEVAKIVLSPKLPIDPGFERVRQPLKKDLNQSLYANAITLTPGTLTVEMDDEHILVHGLIKSHVKNLEGSALEKAFIDLEGKNI
jgi:multicomponent Na+:H+ antiporter subunit E